MATCPECGSVHDDDLPSCANEACALADVLRPVDDVLAEGTMAGEYRIHHKLGSGTFGDVYAGEHPLIGKKVAVKVLNRRFASDPEMVSRFIAEARAVNRIRQSNIIDIFSFGVLHDRQRQYLVMELLDGLSLRDLLIRKRRLSLPSVITIVSGIAAALDAVHEAGITHRDLKPDNVFLATERDGSYTPKLLDFGIAKLINDDLAHKTGSGVVLGTPQYMSPEQARGRKADHLSDIYSLGVMIHEMLTGAPPFTGESSVDVLLKHTAQPPPSMSSVCADLPRELDAPVLAMLSKRPRDRPMTAGRAVELLVESARGLALAPLESAAVQGASDVRETPDRLRAADWAADVARRRESLDATTLVSSDAPAELRPDSAPSERDAALNVGATPDAPKLPDGEVESSRRGDALRSGQSTEGLAAVDTSNSLARREGTGRRRLVAAAALVIAGGVGVWALRPLFEAPRAEPMVDSAMAAPTVMAAPTLEAARRSEPSSDPTVGLEAAAMPSGAAAEPEPTVVAADPVALSGVVEVRLSTRPADVEVWLDDRKIGTSSAPLSIPRGSGRVALRLKKPGFKDEGIELTPDHNQSLQAFLSPLPTSTGREGRPAGAPGAAQKRMDRLLGDRD
jgi:serine/threonine-protein kinase